ncbi:MAG: hypothetical protein ACJ0A3_02410 [Dehalococcoidia bacterium]
MDDKIESLIGTMKVMTRDNLGAVINPVAFDDGVLTIEYFEGENEECPECLMSPDSFQDMFKRMCSIQAPHVTDVNLIEVKNR